MNIAKEFEDLKAVIEDAGKLARRYFDSDVNPSTQKEDGSVVTEIDEKIEEIIRAHVSERFPDDTIVGEEGDDVIGTSDYVWYIDPIDGTDNFVRKIPFFAVTATRLGPGPEDSFAIIHNPISGQTFASLMEGGTYENEHLCNLTADTIGGRYFITVAGNNKYGDWVRPTAHSLWKHLYNKFGKSGTNHSALLEFSYVAAGRIDGFLSIGHKPWDSAAGLYLVKAAGGAISIFEDGRWQRYEGPIKELYGEDGSVQPVAFVSHPDIHDEILDFIGDPKQWADK